MRMVLLALDLLWFSLATEYVQRQVWRDGVEQKEGHLLSAGLRVGQEWVSFFCRKNDLNC